MITDLKTGNLSGWPKNLETWNNLEFDYLGKKKLEKPGICTKVMEKPRILYKNHCKTWNFLEISWKNLELFLISTF